MTFPEPVITVAIEPETKADQDKLARRSSASPRRTRPSASSTDEETGQTIIAGMGELHLEVLVDRMIREFKVDANVGKPQVAYRETIRQHGRKATARHAPDRRQGQFGRRRRSTSSRPSTGAGYEFDRQDRRRLASRASTSRRSTPGIQEAMAAGVLAGFPWSTSR